MTAKINLSTVKSHCNMSPYLKLVRSAIKHAENGRILVSQITNGMAYIRSHEYDFLGDVSIPESALVEIQS